MLSKIAIVCCVALAASAPCLAFSGDAKKAAADLAAEARNVDHVDLYFVSRTDNYSLNVEELKHHADIRIHRNCGANCGKVLSGVISHLEHAAPANCLHGQQNILIEIGDVGVVVYSYSGRMIFFDGRCFFNKHSISSIVENEHFIFQ